MKNFNCFPKVGCKREKELEAQIEKLKAENLKLRCCENCLYQVKTKYDGYICNNNIEGITSGINCIAGNYKYWEMNK